ncbi:MAG: hypothetical protein ACI8QZ_004189 [Chlamydiales bacterium]
MQLFLRTVLLGGVVAIGGWWTYFFREKVQHHELQLAERDQQIEVLVEEVSERDDEIAKLEMALWLSKIDHRVAQIEVLEQTPSESDPEILETRLRFIELTPDGEPLGEAREIVVQGSRVYIEALVMKFDDQFVEAGDLLRGSSVCIFKRIFGDNQKPNEGVELDKSGTRPLPYLGDNLPSPLYKQLWDNFWDYANDPDLAREKGVRAIHGEAPFTEMRAGRRYRIELRASGGLSIQAE